MQRLCRDPGDGTGSRIRHKPIAYGFPRDTKLRRDWLCPAVSRAARSRECGDPE